LLVNRHRREHLARWAEYDSLFASRDRKPNDWFQRMKTLADYDDDETLTAQACLTLADEYAVLAAAGAGAARPEGAPADAAREYYGKVIRQFRDKRPAVGMAHYGLGKLAETLGDEQAATAEYDAVSGMTELPGHPVVLLAELAKKDLQSRMRPVPMAATKPATQPPPMPATAPAIGGPQPAGGR
ncbi:MAG TPA: hypothetical protein VM098_01835, partial [Phycisphaerae bacterium]|nr:hypothetical protein [Phycisphaerae bacterium]